jgi:hypothetical protein
MGKSDEVDLAPFQAYLQVRRVFGVSADDTMALPATGDRFIAMLSLCFWVCPDATTVRKRPAIRNKLFILVK